LLDTVTISIFYTVLNMYLFRVCKIIVACLASSVAYSATSNSIADVPDIRMIISSLGRIAEGQSLSADEILSVQSFIFSPRYAGEVARLLIRPGVALPPLALPVASPAASRSGQIDGTIIPLENRENTFENFYTKTTYADKVQRFVKTFVDSPLSKGQSQFMYWQGASGRGKTHLAVSTAKTLASHGKKVLFLSASKMHSYFQGMSRTGSSLSAEQYFGAYDMVIIDALNSIDLVQLMYLRGLLFDIAFDRGGLKVIVTSNIGVNTFIESLSFESSSRGKLDFHYFSTRIDVLLDRAPSNGIIDFSRLPSMRG